MDIQQHQNMRDHKGEKQRTNQESYDHQNCSSSSTPPSSNSSSPSHEFSFTISFQQTKQIPLPSSSSSSTTTTSSSFAIDLSPADDIFFHGHLLPLHLLSHLPISSPRSSTNSLDSYTLPKKDHVFHQDQNFQDFKNQRVLLDDHDTCCDPILHQTPHIARTLMHRTAHDTCCDVKGKPKAKSFSLFGIPKWRKGYEVNDQKDSNKERSHSQQYSNKMTQLVKRYIRMVRPFLSFRNKKNMQFHRESYSFSGNLLSSRGIKGQYSSAPASMRTSPTNSGLLVATPTRGGAKGQPAALKLPLYTGSREGPNHKDLLYATEGGANYNNCTNSSSYSSSDSTMEELQAAIQAAIAHCKKSISMEDKIK
ncbi:BRI1 kinase inhibitor 1 [Capsicum chacoense]